MAENRAVFNPLAMPLARLCGYWTEHNHLGITIEPRGKIEVDVRTYDFRLKNKDNPKMVSFLHYVAFLADPKHRKVLQDAATGYEAQKRKAHERAQELSLSGRDIGDLPDVVDPERKKRCERDFRAFCETYTPNTYALGWSDDHLRVIKRIETSVLEGGLFALAMPRGSGKSSMAETAALWAMVYGHREFVMLVGATEAAALEMMDSIKTELESNEILAEDFPEITYPIQQLDGIANRCAGQLYHGERTKITWTANELVLPTIAGSVASGVVIRVAGLTGRIRGAKFKRPDGRSVRPRLVIVDDPQTTESANSIEQTRKRVRILASDILGLAGPGQKMSGVMPCTVIKPGDMADQILDRTKHPEWNGERTKMLYAEPTNKELWEEYSVIRAESLQEDGNFARATEFYRQHREEMDAGAVVAWEARYNSDELSALQHAMNLKLTDEMAFQAEYQNDPMVDDSTEEALMSTDEICQKLNNLKRAAVPLDGTRLTMFVDIQKTLLFYTICAWNDDFTGAVIDYGAWPEQNRLRYTPSDADPVIQDKFPDRGFEGQIYASLESLFREQIPREFVREDGAVLHIERALIDANWGMTTDTVYQYCRQSEFAGIVLPAHGRYVGAASKPMTEYRKQRGDRIGFNWMMPGIAGKRAIRHVVFDTNFWKSFVHARLSVAMGDSGCLSLFGKSPLYHQLFAEHLTAEFRVKTQGRGREVDEWSLRPGVKDNHWLDCLAGCAVGASMLGSALPEQYKSAPVVKQRITLSSGNVIESTSPKLEIKPGATGKQRLTLSEIQRQKR